MNRVDPPGTAGERAMLENFLDYHRATLEMKCEGLDAEQLARRSSPPSTMSLLGLVRHLAEVETVWSRRIDGRPDGPRFYSDDDPDGDFNGAVADDASVAEAFDRWRAASAECRRISAAHGLDEAFTHPRGEVLSHRWVLVHLIEEYARHNGHADLMREAIDGATGE